MDLATILQKLCIFTYILTKHLSAHKLECEFVVISLLNPLEDVQVCQRLERIYTFFICLDNLLIVE